MKALIISIGLGALVAGCNMPSDEDSVEASIRNNLSAQGNVQQVELTRQDENNLSGFAVVRDRNGVEGRFTCTAQRAGTQFNWHCNQQVDAQVIQRTEANIRQTLARQGEVRQVDLNRQDDNRMTGYAIVAVDGNEVRLNCNATREAPDSTNFNWQCNPEGQAAAQSDGATQEPADAETESKPAN